MATINSRAGGPRSSATPRRVPDGGGGAAVVVSGLVGVGQTLTALMSDASTPKSVKWQRNINDGNGYQDIAGSSSSVAPFTYLQTSADEAPFGQTPYQVRPVANVDQAGQPVSVPSNTSPAIVLTQAQSPYTLQASDSGKAFSVASTAEFTLNIPTGLGAAFAATYTQTGDYPVTFVEVGTTVTNTNNLRIKSSAAQAEGLGSPMIRGKGLSVTLSASSANVLTLSGQVAKLQHVSSKSHYPDSIASGIRQMFCQQIEQMRGKAGESIVGAYFGFVNVSSFTETVATVAISVGASIEYPVGPTTPKQQVKFGGNALGVMPANTKTLMLSDYLLFTAPIPVGDYFRTATYQTSTGGVMVGRGQQPDQLFMNDASVTISRDYTMVQTGSQPVPSASIALQGTGIASPQTYGPTVIIGVTNTGALIILGDSRSQPSNGDFPTIGSTTRYAGESERSAGALGLAMLNLAVSGDGLSSFNVAGNSAIRRQCAKFGGPVRQGTGVNDLNSGTTGNIDGFTTTLKASAEFVGRKVYGSTMPPSLVNTSDRLTTLGGQSQSNPTNEAKRVALNDNRRNGLPVGLYDGYWELADIIESSRNSGLIKVSARARKITDAVMTVGSNILTSATAAFDPADDGHLLSGNWGAIVTGTAQAASASDITLAASLNAFSTVQDAPLTITGGTGAGQVRRVLTFNSTTKVATVDSPWTTVPDATSTYGFPALTTARMTYISATQVSLFGYMTGVAFNAVSAVNAGIGNGTAYINAYELMADTYVSNHETQRGGELIEANVVQPTVAAVGPIN